MQEDGVLKRAVKSDFIVEHFVIFERNPRFSQSTRQMMET